MKRSALEKYLRGHGAQFVRHGRGHDKWASTHGASVIPRHRDVAPTVVRAICEQLGVPAPPNPN